MDVMMGARAKAAEGGEAKAGDSQALKRLEFEMALEIGDTVNRSLTEIVRQAAEAAGGDLLFVLPALGPNGRPVEQALVRLVEDESSQFVQVRASDGGLVVSAEAEIDADLLGFARASIDVLERLREDRSVLAPLAAAAH